MCEKGLEKNITGASFLECLKPVDASLILDEMGPEAVAEIFASVSGGNIEEKCRAIGAILLLMKNNLNISEGYRSLSQEFFIHLTLNSIPRALEEMDPAVAAEVLGGFSERAVAKFLEQVSPAKAVSILKKISSESRSAILGKMSENLPEILYEIA